MTDQMALFTMATAALGAAVVGINNEPTVAAGRLKDLHRKFGIDLRKPSEIANGQAAERANKLAAAVAIATVSVIGCQQLFG